MSPMSVSNANQFIGSRISLISKSEIRYDGILYALDLRDATISLAKVRSFGTEDRPTDRPIPPKDEIYEFIIFRGADIKGIDVLEPPKQSSTMPCGLPNDPAIIEVSHFQHGGNRSYERSQDHHSQRFGSNNPAAREGGVFDGLLRGGRSSGGGRRSPSDTDRNNRSNNNGRNYNNRGIDGGRSREDNYRQQQRDTDHQQQEGRGRRGGNHPPNQNQRRGNSGNRGDRERGQPQPRGIIEPQMPPKVTFNEAFDFEKSHQELKAAMEELKIGDEVKKEGESADEPEVKKEEPLIYYDKDKFFDNISCEALERTKASGKRVDWRAERKLNAETFGLPWNPNQRDYQRGQRYNNSYRPRGGNFRGGYRNGGGSYNGGGGGGGNFNSRYYNSYRYENRNSSYNNGGGNSRSERT